MPQGWRIAGLGWMDGVCGAWFLSVYAAGYVVYISTYAGCSGRAVANDRAYTRGGLTLA